MSHRERRFNTKVETTLEERIGENFHNFMKDVKTQIEKAPKFPNKTNNKKASNFRVKLKKIKVKKVYIGQEEKR